MTCEVRETKLAHHSTDFRQVKDIFMYKNLCPLLYFGRYFWQMIRNQTKNKIIADDAELCEDILSKSLGLMFSRKKNNALIFKFNREKTIALHMIFVSYPIDVLFLDKNKNIVDIKENFEPFAFYKSGKKAMYAIGLPNGTVKKTGTEIGDKIEI